MNKKIENKMYFINDHEYIKFPFSSCLINYKNNNTKLFGNQLICLNPIKQEVNALERI